MSRPRILDLFCGAGGASVGFHRAGFEVVGVDVSHQRRYPFEFYQADWLGFLEAHYREFDLVAASPPCQRYSRATAASGSPKSHPDLVGPVRAALQRTRKPYIIENVPGAPLNGTIMLCGTMFGLRVIRHRIFECWPEIWWPPSSCNHWAAKGRKPSNHLRNEKGKRVAKSFENSDMLTVTGNGFNANDGRKAMEIDWMTGRELSQAIPPAYTEWLGRQMLKKI